MTGKEGDGGVVQVMTRRSARDPWVQRGGHLAGNTDAATAVGQVLGEGVECRYVRFHPTAWFEHVSMRVELYGERLHQPPVDGHGEDGPDPEPHPAEAQDREPKEGEEGGGEERESGEMDQPPPPPHDPAQ